jgi:hypothetical protein
MRLPSLEKATDSTPPVCPLRICKILPEVALLGCSAKAQEITAKKHKNAMSNDVKLANNFSNISFIFFHYLPILRDIATVTDEICYVFAE